MICQRNFQSCARNSGRSYTTMRSLKEGLTHPQASQGFQFSRQYSLVYATRHVNFHSRPQSPPFKDGSTWHRRPSCYRFGDIGHIARNCNDEPREQSDEHQAPLHENVLLYTETIVGYGREMFILQQTKFRSSSRHVNSFFSKKWLTFFIWN